MARTTRATAAVPARTTPKRSAKSVKQEETPSKIKEEQVTPLKPDRAGTKRSSNSTGIQSSRSKRLKKEEEGVATLPTPELSDEFSAKETSPRKAKKSATEDLKAKKLKAYSQFAKVSPFPDFSHPTSAECKLGHKILASLHGARKRPKTVVASTTRAGCGDSPSVLDALVRTILSQNTSDKNSTAAKLAMDRVYGGSDKWDAIVDGGEEKLEESIRSGGLSKVKSRVIISILRQAKEKYGEYSLDHLHTASTEDAMTEMLSFQGVGPKTASCVLLFCLQREDFAVDTHVHRITGLLGWRPAKANREQTYAHLNVRIPDEDKFGLHILLVTHGKKCEECKAGGKNLGKCELRKAFRKGKLEGEAGEDVKQEEEEEVKVEDS